MLMIYGECRQNAMQAAALYAARFPDRRHFGRKVFTRLANRLRTTGNVKPEPRQQKQDVLVNNEDMSVDVLAAVTENPHVSTRDIARDRGISQSSVSRILRKNKFHPYRISLLQELSQHDFNMRIQFCTWAQNKLEEDPGFFRFVLWSDEATFKSDGTINRHNLHYWNEVNPHWMRTVDYQHRWSVNVWAGIIGVRLIGPFFFEESLTTE
ncbi:transposable element tc3 transposase, partial [Lasius niger]